MKKYQLHNNVENVEVLSTELQTVFVIYIREIIMRENGDKVKIETYQDAIKYVEDYCDNLDVKIVDGTIDYKEGYDILNEFFDCIPDEEKKDVHEKLCKLGL